jgi:hypothetical protein
MQRNRFRTILPVSQTVLALFLGGSGLWARHSILAQPFFGDTTSWNSTARFHVWPWPYKFAVVLNMPAFLAGSLFPLPVGGFRPPLSETISHLSALLVVPPFWYAVGSVLDRRHSISAEANKVAWLWILILGFVSICAAIASIPVRIGGYVSFVPLGVAVWVMVGYGVLALLRKRGTFRAGARWFEPVHPG